MHDSWSYFNQKPTLDHALDRHGKSLATALRMLGTEGDLPTGFLLVTIQEGCEPSAKASVFGSAQFKEQIEALKSAMLKLIATLDESLALEDG